MFSYSPGRLQILYVANNGLELPIFLPPPPSPGITDMHQRAGYPVVVRGSSQMHIRQAPYQLSYSYSFRSSFYGGGVGGIMIICQKKSSGHKDKMSEAGDRMTR